METLLYDMKQPFSHATRLEFIRFSLLGLKANGLYFLLYALITMAGLDPRAAVVAVFAFGAAYSFWLNKLLVFKNAGSFWNQFSQYVVIYATVCVLNVAALHLAISQLAMNHLVAQGTLVCLFALALFFAQKYIIFGGTRK